MRVKNDGTLIKDYRILKNRELFLKLFKDFEWDLNLHKRYFEEKGLEKKYNFMHSDFYLDKKKEFIREMLYFKYSNELPHFSKNFFSVPGYYGYNKRKKFIDEKGNETGERIDFYSPGTRWYKILEFATPEVSICDYKAFCNYVKKEIGLYDFEQIPRIKAVLDKRRELVKEWSIKFREFASKYFDLSNVVEVEDEELIEAFTDYYWYPGNYFVKHCLRPEFRELLDKDLQQDPESLRQKYNAFEKANPISYKFSYAEYTPLSAESSEVTQVDDTLYFKLIKEYMWHTRDSYNMDSHLFRRFAAAPVAKLLAVEVLKYIIDNLVYFRWWYGGLYDADYDSGKYKDLLYKRAFRDRIFLINFVNFNNEYKIGGTRMLGSYENVYKFIYFCGNMTEAYLDRIFGCGSLPHRGARLQPYINAEELLGPVVLNQKRKDAFIKLGGLGGDDVLYHNVISTTVGESFSSHYNAIVKHKDTGEVIKDRGSLKGYKGDFYRNFIGGMRLDEDLLLFIEHFDFNSVLKDPSPVESTEFTDAYIDYMEFCFEKYLEDNKHYLSGSESDFIYYKVTDKTYDRVPARLLDLQLNLGDFFHYLARRWYDEEEIRIDWKRVLR
jgi:hypothetical protein